jgi:hypothetical protein
MLPPEWVVLAELLNQKTNDIISEADYIGIATMCVNLVLDHGNGRGYPPTLYSFDLSMLRTYTYQLKGKAALAVHVERCRSWSGRTKVRGATPKLIGIESREVEKDSS